MQPNPSPDERLIHQGDQISVWYHPKRGVIQHQVSGYCYGAPYRAALEAGAAALRQFHAPSWLSDDRHGGALSPADEEWCRTVWAPKLIESGWKYWAVVRPQSAVGRLNVSRLLSAYRSLGVRAETFAEPAAALTWLEEQRRASVAPWAPDVGSPSPEPTQARLERPRVLAQSRLETMIRMTESLRVPRPGMIPPRRNRAR